MGKYYLSRDVFMCETCDYPVLLDLRSDRYVAITPDDASVLAQVVSGWPSPKDFIPAQATTTMEAVPIVRNLLDNKLITATAHEGRPATPVSIEPPVAPLIDGYEDVPAPFRLRDVARVVRSVIVTKSLLRTTSLSTVVRRIQTMKARACREIRSISAEADRTLAAQYAQIRPLVFTSRKECMLDSFVMSEFLTAHRSFAHCVFGVRSSPFAAHCWVQRDGVVFNDTPDYVRKFTPIMIV